MILQIGAEVRYMGQRVKVLGYPQDPSGVAVDVIYMTGSFIGREVTVSGFDLEPLDATARPTFSRSQAGTAA